MIEVQKLLSLCFLVNYILVISIALVNSNGLKIRMIHSHSPESPFFQTNISHLKRIKILASQSNIRANYLLKKTPPLTMHADVDVQLFYYIVKIGIGTFKSNPSYKEYYLDMDTGSSLTWLQCDGCTKCFKQTPTPFPKDKSSSFHPILKQNKPVPYDYKYEDGDSTNGVLAHETFHLKTKNGGLAKMENIQFGCGLRNEMGYGKTANNKIAGIMGLGWDDTSFVKQLGPKIKGKFSYCLPVIISGKTPSSTYLRFGDDNVAHNKKPKSTSLYKKNTYYYVEMQGISINKARLNISKRVFAFKNNDSRKAAGCIIDTGTPYSRIITPAFRILKHELEKYFSRTLKGFEKSEDDLGLELCYGRRKAEGFRFLPDITFHLQGSQADLVLKAEAAFEFHSDQSGENFCLAMVRDDDMSIIGAHQQTNHRMMLDTKNKKLVFYPEDCSKNP